MFNHIIPKLLYKFTSNIPLKFLDYLLPKDRKYFHTPLMQWHFPAIKNKRVNFVEYLDLISLDDFKTKNKHLLNSKIPLIC